MSFLCGMLSTKTFAQVQVVFPNISYSMIQKRIVLEECWKDEKSIGTNLRFVIRLRGLKRAF